MFMRYFKGFKNSCFLLIFFLACHINSAAQPDFGDDNDVNDVPVDGEIGMLLAIGLLYGIKKFIGKRKQQ